MKRVTAGLPQRQRLRYLRKARPRRQQDARHGFRAHPAEIASPAGRVGLRMHASGHVTYTAIWRGKNRMKIRWVVAICAALGVALLPGVASAGTGWVIQPTPNPASGGGEGFFDTLEAVSCISASDCTATGNYSEVGAAGTEALHWDGTSWQIQPTPNPATNGSTPELRGIKCVSDTFCMATGQYTNPAGIMQTLAESWDGTAWSIVVTPNPAGATTSQLNAVACTATANCIAVGYYQNSAGTNLPLAERWNGTSWALQSVPATTGGHLRGVSCTSASACTAVGYAGNNGLADRWNGTAWKTQTVPKPTGAKSIQLNGIKCTSSTVCTAAGSGVYPASPFNVTKTLAERWNGTAWKSQAIPTPSPSGAGGVDVLTAISCTSASACTAVGDYANNQVLEDTLAESWNGTAWTIQSTLNNNADNSLLGVACATATICTAVGESDGDGGFSSGGNLAMQRT